jgi:hypothetical protein
VRHAVLDRSLPRYLLPFGPLLTPFSHFVQVAGSSVKYLSLSSIQFVLCICDREPARLLIEGIASLESSSTASPEQGISRSRRQRISPHRTVHDETNNGFRAYSSPSAFSTPCPAASNCCPQSLCSHAKHWAFRFTRAPLSPRKNFVPSFQFHSSLSVSGHHAQNRSPLPG